MVNIFQDPTKKLPKQDSQIVRIDFETNDLGGRKDHLPKGGKAEKMGISHVSSKG